MDLTYPLLDGKWIDLAGLEVLFLDETGSTNDDCLQLADEIDGEFVIWAEHQTAGRGREDRVWFDQPGTALTFSVLMRLKEEEVEHLGKFTALGALSLIDLLERAFELKAMLKWPNDVLLNDKKVCGILTEVQWKGSVPAAVVLGMGINLTDEAFEEAEELHMPATSLEAEGEATVDEQALLEGLLYTIQQRRQLLGSQAFLDDWNAKLAYVGQFVEIKKYQGETGRFSPEYVNSDGSLTVRDEEGELLRLYSSELSSPDPSSGS